MAQIKAGKVVVTNGSTTVTGVDVDWTDVAVNNIFVVKNRAQSYLVIDVDFDEGTETWTLELERNYNEASSDEDGLDYAIHKDFTPFYNLPMLASGDIETASILTRALMRIDVKMSEAISGGGSTGEIDANLPGNDFVIGTALYITGAGAYAKASSGAAVTSVVVGIVSDKDGSDFSIRTNGLITGMSGLSAGTIYYLKGGAAVPINWDIEANVSNKIPLFQALSSDTVFILNFASSQGSPFTGATSGDAGIAGLVPAPAAGYQSRILSGAGTWIVNTPASETIKYDQLWPRQITGAPAADITPSLFTSPAGKSIADQLYDLLNRAKKLDLRQVGDAHGRLWDGAPGTNKSFVVPAGVHRIFVQMWGGGAGGSRPSITFLGPTPTNVFQSCGGGSGAYAHFFLNVEPGATYTYDVGSPGTGGGNSNAGAQATNGGNTELRLISTVIARVHGGQAGSVVTTPSIVVTPPIYASSYISSVVIDQLIGGFCAMCGTVPPPTPDKISGVYGACAPFAGGYGGIPTVGSHVGSFPGGGGAGSFYVSPGTYQAGGNGANGAIRIHY